MKQKHLFLFSLSVFLFFSCDKNENLENSSNISKVDTNFVNKNEAIAMATMLDFEISNSNGTKSTTYLEVDNVTPIGIKEKPSYYVINYENNTGFVIIAADKRANPILAYSTSTNFELTNKELPEGLIGWMNQTDEYIQNIREEKIPQLQLRRVGDDLLCEALKSTNPNNANCFDPGTGCPPQYQTTEIITALVKSKFHQGVGYNDLLKDYKCSKYSNGRPPVGCVATAMTQIMKYYEHPKTYNWSAIPNNYGSTESARLMKEAGSFLNMDYDCEGSSSNVDRIPNVLKNRYGYSSATYGDFDHNIVIKELRAGRPVILRGGRRSNGILPIDKDGHAWVCDGFIRTTSCTYSSLLLSMNWGWGGSYDGYFGVSNFSPGNSSYNYRNKMIYNIRP